MQTENNTYTTYDRGWILRIRPVKTGDIKRVMLLIHGWTGDENSMWVFARQIPDDYLIIAPRGPISGPSGFGWAALDGNKSPAIQAYLDIANKLIDLMAIWLPAHKANAQTPVHLMGFSQGAALSYAILAQQPERIAKTAGLSGFLPSNASELLPAGHLAGKDIFVAHGTEDKTIPLELAKQTVQVLEQAGAQVYYCEEEVGHKLGAACFRGLKEFFE